MKLISTLAAATLTTTALADKVRCVDNRIPVDGPHIEVTFEGTLNSVDVTYEMMSINPRSMRSESHEVTHHQMRCDVLNAKEARCSNQVTNVDYKLNPEKGRIEITFSRGDDKRFSFASHQCTYTPSTPRN